MDLLTLSVNVPAERAKLRALRDEIASDVSDREKLIRLHGIRGFRRLPDVPALAAEEVGRHGETSAVPVRAEADLDLPAAAANLRETQAGCRGCGRCACGLGGKAVK